MIILASAIILSLSSGDIRGKANESVISNDISTAKEVVAVARSEWEINYEELISKYENFGEYATIKLKEAGMKVTGQGSIEVAPDGTIYEYPKIPEGFVASIYDDEQKIVDGLVIYKTDAETLNTYIKEDAQKTFDQFVWVPVNSINNFGIKSWKDNKPINNVESEYCEYMELYNLGYSTEIAEYNSMKSSVAKYKGFYVARYEAGKGESDNVIVSRKGAVAYNNITWGNSMSELGTTSAAYLANNMYVGNNTYSTHLIYGSQWDATLIWLSDKYNVSNSDSWGNYQQGGLASCGYNEKWKAKNIYDFAGNLREWTMEVDLQSKMRYERGGYYLYDGDKEGAGYRQVCPAYIGYGEFGFRVALYLV